MTFAAPGLRGVDRRAAAISVGSAAFAIVVGYASLDHTRDVVLVVGLPFLVLLLRFPQVAGTAAIALLPLPNSLNGGGLAVSATDILGLVACVGALLSLIGGQQEAWRRMSGLKPVAPFLGVYGGLLILNLGEHAHQNVVVGLVQRVGIVVVPLVLGALVMGERARLFALRGFVATASVLALATLAERQVGVLGVQKNPAGGFMACALLILLLRPDIGLLARLLTPILAGGLILGESRGALVGLALAGGYVIVARGGGRGTVVKRLLPLAVILAVAVSAAPDKVQQRLTHTSASNDYAQMVRDQYSKDARTIIAAHPLTGVGVNNYLAGEGQFETVDPHNVVYAEAAMGGFPLAIGLGLVLGSAGLMLIRRRRDPLAVLAMAVQIATLGHAFADVYWVRNTPTLGWYLTGQSRPMGEPTATDKRRERTLAAHG